MMKIFQLIFIGLLSTVLLRGQEVADFDALNDSIQKYSQKNIARSIAFADEIIIGSRKRNLPLELIKGLRTKGILLRRTDKFEKADSLLSLSIEEAQNIDNTHEQALGWLEKGDVSYFSGRLYDSVDRYGKSADLYTSIGDSASLCQVYKLQGYSYVELDEIQLAMEALVKSYTICTNQQNDQNAGGVLNSIGILFAKQGQHLKADSTYRVALKIFEKVESKFSVASTYNNIGIQQKNLEDYIEAKKMYDQAMNIFMEVEDDIGIMNTSLNLAILANLQSNPDEAIKLCDRTIAMAKDNPRYIPQKVESYKVQAEAHKLKGNIPKAIELATRALSSTDFERKKGQVQEIYEIRSNLYKLNGSFAKALEDYQSAIAYRDTIYDIEKIKKTAQLSEKFESDIKSKEIALLTANAELDRIKRNRLIGGILGIGILGIGLVYFLLLKRKKEQTLFRVQSELQKERLEKERIEKDKLQISLDFKQQELMAKALQIFNKNELLQSINDKVKVLKNGHKESNNNIDRITRQIETGIESNAEWKSFLQSFSEIHKDFITHIRAQYPNMTSNQIRLVCLIKMDLSTKEIANIMNVSLEGVKKAKHRLKKRMNVSVEEGLIEFIHGI